MNSLQIIKMISRGSVLMFHLSIPMLCKAVSKIFLTSSLSLQFFMWSMLFQFYFTTTNVGIDSTKNYFVRSGAWSASIFIRGTLCYAFSCSAKGSKFELVWSFFFIKSRTATPPPSYKTDWILAFDFAVVLMTTMLRCWGKRIYIIVLLFSQG